MSKSIPEQPLISIAPAATAATAAPGASQLGNLPILPSIALEMLSEIDITSPGEDAPPIEDFVPKSKRLPNVGQTSREELEFRYDRVSNWISLGKRKSEIKKLAYEAWGIKPRTFENYYTAAYKILREAADISPDEQFNKSVAFYERMIADDDTDPRDKIAARKALDELLGIQKPRKTAQVGANGKIVDPVSGESVVNLTVVMNKLVAAGMSDEQLAALAKAGEIYDSVQKGIGVTNGSSDTPA